MRTRITKLPIFRNKKEKAEKTKNEDLREDFDLVSDYLRSQEGEAPTDDEIMEKILNDSMKKRLTKKKCRSRRWIG